MDNKSPQSLCYRLCLVASIIINLLCLKVLLTNKISSNTTEEGKHLYVRSSASSSPSSSSPSSSSLSSSSSSPSSSSSSSSSSCSGHGRSYLDGSDCECNACFGGPDCSQLLPDCTLDADSGNPLFLEPFWMKNAAKSEIVIPGWYRMGYEFEDNSLISKELVHQIIKLHQFTKNANTENKYIIFGAGSTQLLNAAVHALSTKPTSVVASVPYYPVYRSQTELFKSKIYKFKGDASLLKKKKNVNSSDTTRDFVEFVTSPNNPDGQLKKGVINSKNNNVKRIHDLAYYWPHYTPIPSPLDEDLMIFTLSKLTGHAGSRFGWALIKDKNLYERMLSYVDVNTYGVPRETQLRALKLINVAIDEEKVGGKSNNIFEFGYETMNLRWRKLQKTLSTSKRFSLQDLPPQHCTFSQIVRPPSPAFAWIKCEGKEDEDCHNVLLEEGKIKGRAGTEFGADKSFVRLSLCKSDDDFDLLLERIQTLTFEENKQPTKELPSMILVLGDDNNTISMQTRNYAKPNFQSFSAEQLE